MSAIVQIASGIGVYPSYYFCTGSPAVTVNFLAGITTAQTDFLVYYPAYENIGFEGSGDIRITAVTGGSVTLTLSWTDDGGTARAQNLITAASAVGVNTTNPVSFYAKAGTKVSLSTTIVASITYNLHAVLKVIG
jgi:hypothetical protein